MTTGEKIKQKREELLMTQQDVADELGIGRSYIAKVELGIKQPTVQLLKGIAGVLRCTMDELVGVA